MTLTIEQKFCKVAETQPERTAIADGETTLTYGQTVKAADLVCQKLTQIGLKKNEPVVVLVSNIAADIASFLGVWKAYGVVVPIHHSAPKIARAALMARIKNRFVVKDKVEVVSKDPPPLRPLLEGAGTIIFTSGSTGDPKGVVLSSLKASQKLEMIQSITNWGKGENALIGLQLTFSFGQWATWLTLLNGGCVHLRGRFDGGKFKSLLETGTIQRFPVVPTMLRHLLQLGGMPHFKGQIMAGGEPLPAALGRQILKAYPQAGLWDIYGLTETGTSDFFVLSHEYNLLAGTIGRSGTEVEWRLNPQSQELEIRSPWGMLGYLDMPETTNTALQDGWFKTGDLAAEEEAGALRLIGRKKDLIVRSGNKISPLEVESVFLSHKEVETALVTGALDPDRGEAIHLAIVLREGSQISSHDLKVWASEYLELYKIPDKIHFVKQLPIGNTGKVDRKALRRSIELAIHIVS